jgi:hypothetical protein
VSFFKNNLFLHADYYKRKQSIKYVKLRPTIYFILLIFLKKTITLGKKLLEYIMSQESSKVISRQWKIIQFLLDSKYVSTADIETHLRNQGIDATQRTIQRDLNLLEKLFPLECRRDCMPYSWRWKRIETTVKGLSITQALILRLVDEELSDLLPEHTLAELAPLLQKAKLITSNATMSNNDTSLSDIFNRPRGGGYGMVEPSIIGELIHGIGNKVSEIYRDTFNIDERETRKVLQELVTILEQYEMPELAQALKE